MRDRCKIRCLALSSVLGALGTVLLLLGSLVEVLDLSVAALASLLVLFAHRELPRPYAVLLYAVTSVLSLLLRPFGTAVWLYVAFAGWYPMVKYHLDHFRRPLGWVCKLLLFYTLAAAGTAVAAAVFQLPILSYPWLFLVSMGLVGGAVFVLYDILLSRLAVLCAAKLRMRIQRFLYRP